MSTVSSRPYPWPYDGDIKPRRTALVVCVDQPLSDVDATVLARLESMCATVRKAGMRVVHLPKFGFASPLAAVEGDLTVSRPVYGGFTGTELDLVLRRAGLTDLLMAGFPFELGADCTMREANDLGYECLLLEDCCSGLSPQTLAGAVSSVTMSGGIFGAVASSLNLAAALEIM